jgi:hypothetical protein
MAQQFAAQPGAPVLQQQLGGQPAQQPMVQQFAAQPGAPAQQQLGGQVAQQPMAQQFAAQPGAPVQQLDGQPTQPIVQQLAVQQGTHAAAEQLSDPSVQPTAQPDTIQQQVQAASFVGLQTREPSVQALPATEHLIRGGPQVPAETVQGFRFTTECKGQSESRLSFGLESQFRRCS